MKWRIENRSVVKERDRKTAGMLPCAWNPWQRDNRADQSWLPFVKTIGSQSRWGRRIKEEKREWRQQKSINVKMKRKNCPKTKEGRARYSPVPWPVNIHVFFMTRQSYVFPVPIPLHTSATGFPTVDQSYFKSTNGRTSVTPYVTAFCYVVPWSNLPRFLSHAALIPRCNTQLLTLQTYGLWHAIFHPAFLKITCRFFH